MTAHASNAYRTVGTTTADPVTLTTMLYDGALKALRRARLFAGHDDRQKFFDETQRAYLIVGELLATLDMDQGELATSLAGVYSWCMQEIVRAKPGDLAHLGEAEKHIERIAQAWKAATGELRAQATAAIEAVA